MANETNYVSSMTPSLYRVHHKLEQYENVNNPIYLLQNEYVPNTPFMRVLAKDILFCRYQFQSLDNDSNLFNDGTDYEKLRMLLRFDYGIDLNVGYYFKRHRLFRLMQYVDSNISQECRKAVLNRGQAEKELSEKLLQLIGDCCKGRPPRLDSNPAFLDIDFKKFESELYRQYHLLSSQYERRQQNTVAEIILHLIFRLRDGGRSN